MKASLLLIIHFHQPVGNFDDVIERVHDRCYKPFLDTLFRHPQVKMNLHFSGSLLEWFESHNPEILGLISKLVKRGQAEILGGAIYEPILSVISEEDRTGQIELMRRNVKSLFKADVKGGWIPERVWEPHLVGDLAKCGIEYIVLDDTHLIYAGLKKEDTYGYYISEDSGAIVRVFPSDKPLRYTIPFREIGESFAYMKGAAEKKEDAIFTYGDDVEKFGEWPGTHKLVYEDKWLERFFEGLLGNKKWLRTKTLSECVKDSSPSGRIYLPPASYEEMLEWALPTEAQIALQKIKDGIESENRQEQYLPFIRGGFFRNFFVKYEEANQMHKKALYVSNMVRRLEKDRPRAKRLEEARRELYKGQCNCAYWHGLFGGLYLYHLRKAVYEHLLKSEKICNDIIKSNKKPKYEIIDFDADSFDEVILQNNHIWLCVKPSSGGTVVEFDIKKRSVNLLNILTRYRESYHNNIASKLYYDGYRRAMLVDHFFGKETTLGGLEKAGYKEEGDFINSTYGFKILDRGKKNRLIMERRGLAHGVDIKLVKELILRDSGLKVINRITNLSSKKREFRFGTELPFIMPEAGSSRYTVFIDDKKNSSFAVNSRGSTAKLNNLKIVDKGADLGLSFDFSKECRLWRFPITTISKFEKGYEENYQGSVIVPHWHFILDKAETLTLDFDINVGMVV